MIRFLILFILIKFKLLGIAQISHTLPGKTNTDSIFLQKTACSKALLTSIEINGNKKTKDYIILREMTLKIGDSINTNEIENKISSSHDLIYNTNLFSEVSLTPIFVNATDFIIKISVLERWYVYPIPQFQWIDRNFNDWWKTYHRDIHRLIYGLKFSHYNFSGRADKLNIYLLDGYSKNYLLNYVQPYSNSRLTQGFSFSSFYIENKEIAIKTSEKNKRVFFKSDASNRIYWGINGSFTSRKGLYEKHVFFIEYAALKIKDTVLSNSLNPYYFNTEKNNVHLLDIKYTYEYTNTDNINYPRKGRILSFTLWKRGLSFANNTNMLSSEIKCKQFVKHKNNFFSSIYVGAKIKLPFRQPYINQEALGYGTYNLRGLEYYVIDGVLSGLSKYTFSKKVFSLKIPLPFHSKAFPYLPLTCYAKSYFDMGYCYNQKEFRSRLNNTFLYSGGFGLDILSLYDMKLSVEYSYNQLNEKGIYLDSRGPL